MIIIAADPRFTIQAGPDFPTRVLGFMVDPVDNRVYAVTPRGMLCLLSHTLYFDGTVVTK